MILVDTGPLVALCNQRDALHTAAVEELKRMTAPQFVVCEAVLIEASFCLRLPMQRHRLRELLSELEATSAENTADVEFWSEVFDWLSKYADHAPDWADACIAVLCGQNRKLKVWTYDREFRTIWRRPDGSAVPMAVKPD